MSQPRAPFLRRIEFLAPTNALIVLDAYDDVAELANAFTQVRVPMPSSWGLAVRHMTVDGLTVPIVLDPFLPPNVVVIVGEREAVVVDGRG